MPQKAKDDMIMGIKSCKLSAVVFDRDLARLRIPIGPMEQARNISSLHPGHPTVRLSTDEGVLPKLSDRDSSVMVSAYHYPSQRWNMTHLWLSPKITGNPPSIEVYNDDDGTFVT
jgi:hypothetical protein